MVERVAPAVLELLADGVPRSRRAIVAELADRHPKDEVVRTLMRLAVTDRVAEIDRKYGLSSSGKTDDRGSGRDAARWPRGGAALRPDRRAARGRGAPAGVRTRRGSGRRWSG